MTEPEEQFTMTEMCAAVGKSMPYMRVLLAKLGLLIARKGQTYPDRYVRFLRKLVALRAFNVPFDDIAELLEKEMKILHLLNVDAISDSQFWFLGVGDNPVHSETHLLLTAHDLGFPLASGDIQCNLDFSKRESELFCGHEMGEDVGRVLQLYLKLVRKVDTRIRAERVVLIEALDWAGSGLLPS